MRIKFISIFMLATTLMVGCSKDYLNINEVNPNQTQNPPINPLLSSVTYQSALNVNRAANITAYYTQQLASPNAASGSDIYDNVDRSSLWYNIYNTVKDGRLMQAQAVAANGFQHVGVAKVMEAMNMSMLIDLFGDAPYSEAFDPAKLAPKYDKAEEIFSACIRLLDEALAEFNKASPTITLDAASDLIHGGSVNAWKKTANALKARLLNRLSKKSTYNPTQILAALSAAYTSNADDAQLTRFTARSPWNQAAYNNTQLLLDAWMSDYSIKVLNGTTYGVFDPRIKYISDTTKFGDYRGTPNGKGRTGTGTNKEESYLSEKNGFYSKSGAPLLLVTYAEMKFIEAEATSATDKTRSYNAYLAGIAAHMDKLGVSIAEKDAYLTNPAVAVGVTNFTRDLIFKEKYLAMFLHPEAWTDARRYDYKYKNFTLPVNAVLPTFIRRVGYPTTETDRNSA
ncbi:MAG: SusD/RagB family nutrient-binding outer membrane lipoprotein, partial [Segetibacter sp.]